MASFLRRLWFRVGPGRTLPPIRAWSGLMDPRQTDTANSDDAPAASASHAQGRRAQSAGLRVLLLEFFAASRSARDALQAELIRDPFVAQRYELIDASEGRRQVQARVGQVV